MNTLQWGDFYSKVPERGVRRRRPGHRRHAHRPVRHQRRPQCHPAARRGAPSLKYTEDDFDPIVWTAGIYKDKRYGIPLDVHPLGLYANKGQLTTGRDHRDADRRRLIPGRGHRPAGRWRLPQPFWITATWPAHLMFISLINQFGGSIYNPEGTQATFNSDAGVESLNWLTSFIASGASPANVASDAQAQAFRQQRNSLTWDGIWMMNEWDKVEGLDWVAAGLPTIGDKPAVWASSHNMWYQPGREGPEQAGSLPAVHRVHLRALIEWAKSGQVPARNSVRESAEFTALPVQSTFATQLPHAVFPPTVAGIGDVTTPTYELAVNEVILGKAQAKEALDSAAAKADQLLADNRAKYGE